MHLFKEELILLCFCSYFIHTFMKRKAASLVTSSVMIKGRETKQCCHAPAARQRRSASGWGGWRHVLPNRLCPHQRLAREWRGNNSSRLDLRVHAKATPTQPAGGPPLRRAPLGDWRAGFLLCRPGGGSGSVHLKSEERTKLQ